MPPFPGKLDVPLLDLSSAGIRMTVKELHAIDDYCEIYDYEIVDGVLVVRPNLDDASAVMSEELSHMLRTYRERHPQGAAMDDTLYGHYIQTSRGYRRAHRVVWIGLSRHPRPGKDIPAIVIEFVSRGRRGFPAEFRLLRDEFHAVGVKEFWVIDRFRRTMTVHYRPPADPRDRVVTEREAYMTPLLPGLEVPLAPLFERADRHAKYDV
jgi:Uma2 family endonuclease